MLLKADGCPPYFSFFLPQVIWLAHLFLNLSLSLSSLPTPLQLMIQGGLPMCSAQYERMFNTTRVPGMEGGRMLSQPLLPFPTSSP